MTTSNLAYELDRLSPMSEMPPVGLRRKESNSLLKRSISSSSSRSHKQKTSPILSINAKVPTPPIMLSSLSPLPAPSPVLSYQSSQPSPMLSSASTMSSFSMNSPNPFFATSPYSDSSSSSRPSPISPYPSPLTPNKNSVRSATSPLTYSPIYGVLPFGPKSNRGVVNLHKAPSSISLRRRAEEDGASFFPGSNLAKAHNALQYSMDPNAQQKIETEAKKTNALWKITKKFRRNANGKKQAPTINLVNTFHRSDTISPTHSLLNSPTEPGTKSVHWTAPAPSALMPEKTVSPRMATFPSLAPLTIYKDASLQAQQTHHLVGPSPLSPAPRKHRAKVSSSLAGDAIEDDGNDVEECADELEQGLKISNSGKNAWRKAGYNRRFLDGEEDTDITNNALRLQGVPSRSPPARAGSPEALAFNLNTPAWTAIRSEGKM